MQPPPSAQRQPLSNLGPNRLNLATSGSYGLSAGAKIGRSASSQRNHQETSAGVLKGELDSSLSINGETNILQTWVRTPYVTLKEGSTTVVALMVTTIDSLGVFSWHLRVVR